jgi:hypothetical protein
LQVVQTQCGQRCADRHTDHHERVHGSLESLLVFLTG